MKKLIVIVLIAALGSASAVAQEIPDRKRTDSRPVHKERLMGKKELASLNLTDDQKSKMKALQQDFRKQMEDLNKQDNITVKEYREKMASLKKNHQSQFQSILTAEQKEQIRKDREAMKTKAKEMGKKRAERMKKELNLTEEQSTKLQALRKANAEKIQSIRADQALSDAQKRDQVREVMKKQQDEMKSVLTEEQLNKMKENRKGRGAGKDNKAQ